MIDDVGDLSRRKTYTATAGQTDFPFPFKVFAAADLRVYVNNTLQTLNSNYTVSGVGDATGGYVIFLSGLNADDAVVVFSDTELARSADYQQNGPWTSQRLNDEFDRSMVIDQETRAKLNRTLRADVLDDEINPLPTAAQRAGKYQSYDANGQPLMVSGAPSEPLSVFEDHGYASAGQTDISLAFSYTPGANHLTLYINGENQVLGVDYTESGANTITLTTPMVDGDLWKAVAGEVHDVTVSHTIAVPFFTVLADGQTAVDVSSAFSYTPGNGEIMCWLNGSLMSPSDFTETNGTTITLTDPAVEDDELYILYSGVFNPTTASLAASVQYPVSAQETAAGITPTNTAYPWGDVRRYGAVNDGTMSDSPAFTSALTAHPESFHVPYTGTDWVTGKLTLPTGLRAKLDPRVVWKSVSTLSASDRFLTVSSNTIIDAYGATVTQAGLYATGINRHNVFIYAITDVTIKGLASDGSGGSGFYVAGNSANVTLQDCSGSGNNASGLYVGGAQHFRDIDGRWGSNGTIGTYRAGISIHPLSATDVLYDVKIVRPSCSGNYRNIIVDLVNVNSATLPIDVEIVSPRTDSAQDIDTYIVNVSGAHTVRGSFKLTDLYSKDATSGGLYVAGWSENGPLLEIARPVIVNPNQGGGTSASAGNGGIILAGNSAGWSGNVRIDEPEVHDYSGAINSAGLSPITLTLSGSYAWNNVDIVDPRVTFAGADPWAIDATSKTVRVWPRQKLRTALTGGSSTLSAKYLGRILTNEGLGGTHTTALPAASAGNQDHEYEFEVRAAQYLEVDPNGTDQIRPGSGGAGYKYRSNTIGSRLKVRGDGAGYWRIVEQIGTWASVA